MNKKLPGLAVAVAVGVLLSTFAVSAVEVRGQVTFAPLSRSYAPPSLGRKQGWLTISNHDWKTYVLVRQDNDKLYLYQGNAGGGMIIPSGATISLALEKDTYDLYGANSERLRVRVREGRTTTLSLEPFGYAGASGLTGVVNDGDRIRDGVLYDAYTTNVIVQQPPTVIVNRPPPPPIIVTRPPAHRPPPPPPPRPSHLPPSHVGPGPGPGRPPPSHNRDRDDDSWGFFFGIGKR